MTSVGEGGRSRQEPRERWAAPPSPPRVRAQETAGRGRAPAPEAHTAPSRARLRHGARLLSGHKRALPALRRKGTDAQRAPDVRAAAGTPSCCGASAPVRRLSPPTSPSALSAREEACRTRVWVPRRPHSRRPREFSGKGPGREAAVSGPPGRVSPAMLLPPRGPGSEGPQAGGAHWAATHVLAI